MCERTMLDSIFGGIFDANTMAVITPGEFLLCVGCAVLAGAVQTCAYLFRTKTTGSFAVTLSLLPAVVCVVIMMVNGNIGAGVAVAGAFSLVRFRSAPGSAREIAAIFMAMGAGLLTGMGYLAYALLFSVLLGGVMAAATCVFSRTGKRASRDKTLHITIPEDLDYTGVFDEIFAAYTTRYELTQVKTTNMGSLFRLTYDLTLRENVSEKDFIDQLRCRNGNLEIMLSCQESAPAEL